MTYKVKDPNNRISYIKRINAIYYHIVPSWGDCPEKKTKIGAKFRTLKRYATRKKLTLIDREQSF